MYEVYLHRNTINGKVYVGLTKHSILQRWKRHLIQAKQEKKGRRITYFHNALIKYGFDVWEHVVLEVCSTLEEAEKAEQKWIEHYKSNIKKYGYNLTSGGSVSQCVLSDLVKQKISKTVSSYSRDPKVRLAQSIKMKEHWKTHSNPFLGKTHSVESRSKISKALKGKFEGENNPYYGKKHTPEIRKKMSEAAKKRCADSNWVCPLPPVTPEIRKKIADARRGKPVGKYSKEQLLEACVGCTTQIEVAEKLGCTPANISFLKRHYNIADEVNKIIKNNKLSSKF